MDEQASQPPDRPEAAAPDKRGVVAGFKALPFPEKMLAAAAVAVLVAFSIRGEFGLVFERWFDRLALLGSLGVVLLTTLQLFNAGSPRGRVRTYALVIFSIAPAAGFVIDELMDVWRAAMLAGAAVMAFAGVKITTRWDLF